MLIQTVTTRQLVTLDWICSSLWVLWAFWKCQFSYPWTQDSFKFIWSSIYFNNQCLIYVNIQILHPLLQIYSSAFYCFGYFMHHLFVFVFCNWVWTQTAPCFRCFVFFSLIFKLSMTQDIKSHSKLLRFL